MLLLVSVSLSMVSPRFVQVVVSVGRYFARFYG